MSPLPTRPPGAMAAAPPLRVGGLVPLTTLDYPGELAAVVFCQGCPWRCRYCQNGHLLAVQDAEGPPWSQVLEFLARRKGLLDAVVLSGGEPTLQAGLPSAMAQLRGMGFKVGLHTAGPYPRRLGRALDYANWVGLDIKAMAEDYPAITGMPHSGERAWASLRMLIASGVPHEVRTTVPPAWGAARIARLAEALAAAGVSHYVLQRCDTARALDPALGAVHGGLDFEVVEGLGLSRLFDRLELRG